MKRTVDGASRAGDSVVVICVLVDVWRLLCHGPWCMSANMGVARGFEGWFVLASSWGLELC
jgi:hypothetical protein